MRLPLLFGRRVLARLLSRSGRALDTVEQGAGDLRRVAAYLRGLLEFVVRADDIFVVTYPRSGTTWVQYMLHLLTRRGQEAGFDHISQVCPWFERSLAVGALRAADLEVLPSPRVFKSHLPAAWLPAGARYIYVRRDGLDVALSYYHFYRSHLGYAGTFERFFSRFLRGDLQYNAWFDHVAGWHRRQDPTVCHLRYEELLADPAAGLERLAAFLALPLPEALRTLILQRTSFESMKAQEARFDFATEFLLQRGTRTGAFLRQGKAGQGGQEIPAHLRLAFEERQTKSSASTPPAWRLPAFLK